MTNKQIMDAQKILRRLDSTPVKIYGNDGKTYWQVTYDNDTYSELLGVVTAVAKTTIKDTYTNTYVRDTAYESVVDYHRDRI